MSMRIGFLLSLVLVVRPGSADAETIKLHPANPHYIDRVIAASVPSPRQGLFIFGENLKARAEPVAVPPGRNRNNRHGNHELDKLRI